jgi:hypothetical protein
MHTSMYYAGQKILAVINKFLLQSNKLKPSELEKFANGWKTFASELNKLEGAQKNVIQWKDVSS